MFAAAGIALRRVNRQIPTAMSDPHNILPRGVRLLKPAQFKAVLSGRRSLAGRHYVIYSIAHDRAGCDLTRAASARIGLAISKRADKRSVGRNRIKRQARESFRRVRARLQAWDFVLLARTSAAGASNAELRADLDRLWKRFWSDTLPPAPSAGTMPGSRPATTPTPDQAGAGSDPASGAGPNATTS